MNAQKIRLAIAGMKRNRLYSFLNITGLAIGFSVVSIITLFLMSEFSKDKNIPEHSSIYRLYNADQKSFAIDYKLNDQLRERYPEIEKACAVRTFYGFDVPLASKKNIIIEKKVFLTTSAFFEMFDVKVLKTLSEQPLPNFKSAVITQSLAQRLYPDEEALGQTINIFGIVDLIINAVVEDFEDKSLNSNLIIHADHPKFANYGMSDKVNIASHYFSLSKNTNIEVFVAKLNTFLSNKTPKIEHAGLMSLDEIYLNAKGYGYNGHEQGNKKMLNIFLAVSVLILLLSLINNFNYSLSLQYKNLKDIGVRKTNGAGTSDLLSIFVSDSFVKVFLSVLMSILITIVALPWVVPLFKKELDILLLVKPTFLFPAILLVTIVIFFNSSASIYLLSKFDIKAFLSGGQSKEKLQIGKKALTVFQLAISIVLLISLFGIKKQISFVKHADIGFHEEQLIRIGLSESDADSFKERVKRLSFVESASLSNGVPGMINYTTDSNVPDNEFILSMMFADVDFLQTMGIELKEGRNFRNSENNKVCILNETAYKKYGWDDFIGRKYKGWGELEVIGITRDFNISSLHNLPVPVCLIFGEKRNDYNHLNIRLHEGNVGQMLSTLEKEWLAMETSVPFNYTFYDQDFDAMYKKEESMGQVLSLLSLIALLITCMGILGTAFQNSINRTKEIGIRKVNGAKITEILAMLNKDFVKWVAIAFVIACPIAYYTMNKWLENFAYKTTLSWWIFGLAGVLALGIALLTVSWQSWRAATRNPVEALRYE